MDHQHVFKHAELLLEVCITVDALFWQLKGWRVAGDLVPPEVPHNSLCWSLFFSLMWLLNSFLL